MSTMIDLDNHLFAVLPLNFNLCHPIDAGVPAPLLTLLIAVAAVMFVVYLNTPIRSEFHNSSSSVKYSMRAKSSNRNNQLILSGAQG